MDIPKKLYEFKEVLKLKDILRNYLFIVSVDGRDDIVEQTSLIRNISWTKTEIIIDTLIDEKGDNLRNLIEMKKLKVSFLSRTGNIVFDDTFDIKQLKKKYPLKIGHSESSILVYRLIYEY